VRETKALVILFHGLCAHTNHGAHYASHLAEIGCTVVGFDYRGFGKSEGERGFIETFHHHMEDCRLFFKKMLEYRDKEFPNVPIFLTGLSLGGLTSFK
jgi:acylglycerol lipase